MHRKRDPILFLALPLLTYTAVVLIPVIASIFYSFTNWNGISEITFAGFDNYSKMFKDSNLGEVLKNTFLYSITATLFQVGGGLFLAVLVSKVRKGSSFLRVMLFTPVVISSMAMAQTFKKLLSINPDGVVNALFQALGLSQFKMAFLADMHITLFVLAVIESLRFAGLYMVVFYTAIVSIDNKVLEAASIDGASSRQTLFHIKFPLMRGIIINCIVLAVVGTLKAFDGPYIMTNGGPGYSTELLSIYMYKRAFNMMDYGYSSALAVLLVVICIVAYRLLDRVSKDKEDR